MTARLCLRCHSVRLFTRAKVCSFCKDKPRPVWQVSVSAKAYAEIRKAARKRGVTMRQLVEAACE